MLLAIKIKISFKTIDIFLLLQLPSEVQAKVRTYVAQKRCSTQDTTQPDVKSITVPISTFPPTAMVYNITKPTVEKHSDDDSDDSKPPMDIVSATIMAKVLEDREKERIFAKHCDTCTCHRSILTVDTRHKRTCLIHSLSLRIIRTASKSKHRKVLRMMRSIKIKINRTSSRNSRRIRSSTKSTRTATRSAIT